MIGVILINFGGPRSGEEIKPFLKNLFNDILPRPLKPLASLLARLREPRARKMYDAIGGASPVVGWTIKQAVALESKLDKNYKVYAGMKYGHPSIRDAIEEANTDGCKKIIMLPLFPYQSRYTNLASRNDTQFYKHPLYISAMVNIIKTNLAGFESEPPPNIHLLFTAHAIPSAAVENEPYVKQIEESIFEITKHFTGYNHYLAFQSQSGPIKWTGPKVKSVLRKIRKSARSPDNEYVLIIPLGFASENIETLFEIDQIYLPYAKNLGFQNIARTPCFNDNPQFIDLLGQLVLDS